MAKEDLIFDTVVPVPVFRSAILAAFVTLHLDLSAQAIALLKPHRDTSFA